MILIQDILISDEVVREHFICQLDACKGACCWEGDFGAPLEAVEVETLAEIFKNIEPFLRKEGVEVIEQQGFSVFYKDLNGYGTPLLPDGACAYLTFEADGVAKCGIEKAWEANATSFKKPISCHLYPVRVAKNEETDFEALNYDRWDICSAACKAGKKAKVPVYQFVKEAIIRKYGEEFYEELHAAAAWLTKTQ